MRTDQFFRIMPMSTTSRLHGDAMDFLLCWVGDNLRAETRLHEAEVMAEATVLADECRIEALACGYSNEEFDDAVLVLTDQVNGLPTLLSHTLLRTTDVAA